MTDKDLTYGPGSIVVERHGDGILIVVAQDGAAKVHAIHLPDRGDAIALGTKLIDVATRDGGLEDELAQIEACRASVAHPSSDSHVCLCLSAPHEGPHQCEECGTRWSG